MTKPLMVNEIFYSIQGEGVRSGTANVFVRLTGCNMECAKDPGPRSPGGFDCDTEFASGRPMAVVEILERVDKLAPAQHDAVGASVPGIIFTGGEPALQMTRERLLEFRERTGRHLAIETNGSIELPIGFDWVTVSPKVAEHAIRQRVADEMKYVRGHGQAIPQTVVDATHYLISPAFDGNVVQPETIQWCMRLVKENPRWRLTMQAHKLLMIR